MNPTYHITIFPQPAHILSLSPWQQAAGLWCNVLWRRNGGPWNVPSSAAGDLGRLQKRCASVETLSTGLLRFQKILQFQHLVENTLNLSPLPLQPPVRLKRPAKPRNPCTQTARHILSLFLKQAGCLRCFFLWLRIDCLSNTAIAKSEGIGKVFLHQN